MYSSTEEGGRRALGVGRSDGGTEVLTTTVPPAAVIEGAFTFAHDDLCDAFDEVDSYEGRVIVVPGHPSLSDGVVVHPGSYGQTAFWVPPSDVYLYLGVSFEDDDGPVPDEAQFFGVADRFVQELGWLG